MSKIAASVGHDLPAENDPMAVRDRGWELLLDVLGVLCRLGSSIPLNRGRRRRNRCRMSIMPMRRSLARRSSQPLKLRGGATPPATLLAKISFSGIRETDPRQGWCQSGCSSSAQRGRRRRLLVVGRCLRGAARTGNIVPLNLMPMVRRSGLADPGCRLHVSYVAPLLCSECARQSRTDHFQELHQVSLDGVPMDATCSGPCPSSPSRCNIRVHAHPGALTPRIQEQQAYQAGKRGTYFQRALG